MVPLETEEGKQPNTKVCVSNSSHNDLRIYEYARDLIRDIPKSHLPSESCKIKSYILFFLLNYFLLLFYYSCPNFSPFALLHPSHPLLPQTIPTLLSMPMKFHMETLKTRTIHSFAYPTAVY